MADFKRHMIKHLHSAKIWLARAEESFDKDSDVRGELDLFLAQAELQHAREKNLSRHWRYKYPFIRHALSLGLALIIVGGGYGAYWFYSDRYVIVPAPPLAVNEPVLVQESKVIQAVVIDQIRMPDPPPVEPVVTSRAVVPPPVVKPAEIKQQTVTAPVVKEKLLPPEEMEKVIRVAEKSLRGQ
ncbi:MAG: hypothetical protein H6Q73_3138 [Firmicutes bacterium]|nr:hypothetical protein [Bacillota bacterium]